MPGIGTLKGLSAVCPVAWSAPLLVCLIPAERPRDGDESIPSFSAIREPSYLKLEDGDRVAITLIERGPDHAEYKLGSKKGGLPPFEVQRPAPVWIVDVGRGNKAYRARWSLTSVQLVESMTQADKYLGGEGTLAFAALVGVEMTVAVHGEGTQRTYGIDVADRKA